MSSEINPNSIVPMYKQVLKILTDKIKRGELKPGDKLPSEATLMSQYNVSRITIRAAITEMVDDGVLERSQGKGTFVAAPKLLYNANDDFGFTRSCILSGKVPTTKLLSAEMIYPMQRDIDFFGVKETDQILCTRRLRFVDDEPTMIETNHYPPAFEFLMNENLEGSLFEILGNKYNIYVHESIRTVEVCFPTKDEAALLNIKQSTPLLLFKDKQRDVEGQPLFTSRQIYCTERLKFYL